jgi:hypothetical protein
MRDGDLREEILGLEAQIEELAETIESCRKIIQISKAFIVVGGLLIRSHHDRTDQVRSHADDRRPDGCRRRHRGAWLQLEHVAAVCLDPESR